LDLDIGKATYETKENKSGSVKPLLFFITIQIMIVHAFMNVQVSDTREAK